MQPFTDLGYTYDYYIRTNLLNFNTINNVNTNSPGNYTIIYTITDYLNSISFVTRNINVIDNTSPPVITLTNGNSIIVPVNGIPFVDPGYTITDLTELPIIPIITGTVNTSINGIYYITYSATNIANLTTTVTRTVNVISFVDFNIDVIPTFTITQFNNIVYGYGGNFSGGFEYILYTNNIYLGVNNDNRTYFISLNKINWTMYSFPVTPTGDVRRYAAGNNVFAISVLASGIQNLYTSTNGINWNISSFFLNSQQIFNLLFVGNYFFTICINHLMQ